MQAACLAISNSGNGSQIRNTLIRAEIRARQLLVEEESSAEFNRSSRERWVTDFCSVTSMPAVYHIASYGCTVTFADIADSIGSSLVAIVFIGV
jgi:hypothetical protein